MTPSCLRDASRVPARERLPMTPLQRGALLMLSLSLLSVLMLSLSLTARSLRAETLSVGENGSALKPPPLPPGDSVARLSWLLESGDVIWMECDGAGQFQQASVFSSLPGSAAQASAIVSDPSQYKAMSPSVDSIEVHETKGSRTTFTSTVRIPFGSITNVIALDRVGPERVDTRFVGGDLKTGQFRWSFVPGTERRSSVIYSLKTDVREANWMIRQLTRIRPETQHGGNAGTGLITVWGLKRVLLGQDPSKAAGLPSPWAKTPVELPLKLTAASGSGGPSSQDWSQLTPFLSRGPLIQVESAPGGRLKRVTVFALAAAPAARVYEVVAHPEDYSSRVSNVSGVEIVKRTASLVEYRSIVEFMKLKYRNTERMELFPNRITTRTVDGDLKGAAGQLELLPMGDNTTLAAWSFYADLAEGGWVMKQIFALDPLVEHIFAVSGGFGTLMGLVRAAEHKPPLFSGDGAGAAP